VSADRALLEIHEALGELFSRHADLEARIERMFRKGKVTDVDATKGLYRQEIGLDDQGQTVKSPWAPYSQIAGARKSHSPPSVGEQYLLVNPDGSPDFTQGLGVPHGWYDQNPSPSTDPAADVDVRGTTTDTRTTSSRTIAVGGSSVAIVDGSITLKSGGVTMVVSGSGVAITGGEVSHNGHDIGSDHKHTEVMSGSALTGPPQ
jgi:phage baseplate assembly protein gpV